MYIPRGAVNEPGVPRNQSSPQREYTRRGSRLGLLRRLMTDGILGDAHFLINPACVRRRTSSRNEARIEETRNVEHSYPSHPSLVCICSTVRSGSHNARRRMQSLQEGVSLVVVLMMRTHFHEDGDENGGMYIFHDEDEADNRTRAQAGPCRARGAR